MSKVNAYICNKCDKIHEEDNVMGISLIEDMFDKFKSFLSVSPEKSEIHFCYDCYNLCVTVPVSRVADRAKDEEGYKLALTELMYAFKKSIIYKVTRENIAKNSKKRK